MVNYREQVTEDVTKAKQNSGSNNGDNDWGGRSYSDLDQIEVDMGSTPFVKFYPTVALTGDVPADEGNPIIRFRDESNNGHPHQGYLGIVVDNLRVDQSEDGGFDMSEAHIVETDDDDYTEYRVVNFNDNATSEKFGGEAVNIDGDQYGIEDTVDSLDERAILVVDRTAALSVAKRLDVAGGVPADHDSNSEDGINSGLIEYALYDDDGRPVNRDGEVQPVSWRYARNPEMRPEFLGDELTLLVSRREEIDDEHTGYLGQDEDNTEPVLGLGEDEETHRNEQEASYAELVAAEEARGMMWYSVFDGEGATVEVLRGDDAGESTNKPYLEWTFDPTANHLEDDQWDFVQEYQAQGLPTDEETILENIRDNFDDADEERMVAFIQNGVGQE